MNICTQFIPANNLEYTANMLARYEEKRCIHTDSNTFEYHYNLNHKLPIRLSEAELSLFLVH